MFLLVLVICIYPNRLITNLELLKIEKSKYNQKHNIQPKTIYKSLQEIKLSTAVADKSGDISGEEQVVIDDSTLDGIESKEILERLQRKMLKCARDLQFEQAALLRDKIRAIEESISYGS